MKFLKQPFFSERLSGPVLGDRFCTLHKVRSVSHAIFIPLLLLCIVRSKVPCRSSGLGFCQMPPAPWSLRLKHSLTLAPSCPAAAQAGVLSESHALPCSP